MTSHDSIPGLAEKLNHLFMTVPAGTRPGLHSNDSAAAALADLGVKVTGTHLSHLRTGRRDNPSARLLIGLAELFGVPIGYFLDPTIEARINGELDELAALRDSGARSVMLRAQGISPGNLRKVQDLLDMIRELEGLDERGDRPQE